MAVADCRVNDAESLIAQAHLYATAGLLEQWYGTLTPEEQERLHQAMAEAFEALTKAFEPLMEEVQEFMETALDSVSQLLETIVEAIDPILEHFERAQAYIQLTDRHLPDWLARVVAYRAPRRWLPRLLAVF